MSGFSTVTLFFITFTYCILWKKSPYAQPTLKERGVVLYLHKDGITGINTFEFFYMGNLSVPHHLLVYLIIYINHFIEFFE